MNDSARIAIFELHDEPLSDYGRQAPATKDRRDVYAIAEMLSQNRIDGMVFGLG
jgi:hypothetical protein